LPSGPHERPAQAPASRESRYRHLRLTHDDRKPGRMPLPPMPAGDQKSTSPTKRGEGGLGRADTVGLLVALVFVLVLVFVAIGGIVVAPVVIVLGSHFGHLPRPEVENQP